MPEVLPLLYPNPFTAIELGRSVMNAIDTGGSNPGSLLVPERVLV
jgi:hypothetical protein